MMPSECESCELRGVWRNIINLSRVKPINFYVFVLSLPINFVHCSNDTSATNEMPIKGLLVHITHHIYRISNAGVGFLLRITWPVRRIAIAFLNYDWSNKSNIINFHGATPTDSFRFNEFKISFGSSCFGPRVV